MASDAALRWPDADGLKFTTPRRYFLKRELSHFQDIGAQYLDASTLRTLRMAVPKCGHEVVGRVEPATAQRGGIIHMLMNVRYAIDRAVDLGAIPQRARPPTTTCVIFCCEQGRPAVLFDTRTPHGSGCALA